MLSNGVFLGHVTPPGTTRSIPFQGVVLQKRAQGFGYFLGASESGSVVIGP
jgi:hypothetical protein